MRKVLILGIIIIGMNLVGCNNVVKSTKDNKISVDEAKEIALNHANLKSDQITYVKVDRDIDNNTEKYDIEFYHENKEYDYEINAVTGEILKYNYDISNNKLQNEAEINNQQQIENSYEISIDEAKEIALKHSNLTSDKVTFRKLELDFDDGIQKYEVEFYYNNNEYSYEIDANSGSILSYELD